MDAGFQEGRYREGKQAGRGREGRKERKEGRKERKEGGKERKEGRKLGRKEGRIAFNTSFKGEGGEREQLGKGEGAGMR